MSATPARAPSGDLSTFTKDIFSHGGFTHKVYRKGRGPAVLVLTELPGISPMVLGFADRIIDLGFSVILPDLFGTAGRDPLSKNRGTRRYSLKSMSSVCISREFTVLATGRTSPVVTWLRALAKKEHARCGGAGVGVVGMCFTGGFALAMAVDPIVLAPVLSQPSLPFAIGATRKASIDCAASDLDMVAQRCQKDGLRVLGLRFKGDPLVPKERFAFLAERLGDGFVAIELKQSDGHPRGPLPRHHSVLTTDLIDEPNQPTRQALEQVLKLFQDKLLAPRQSEKGESAL